MKKFTIVTIMLALGLASCSELLKDLPTEPGSFGPRSQLVPDITGNPAPGRPGPYEVCTNEYDLLDPKIRGMIYVPVTNKKNCVVNRKFNLVLIAHADGATTDHLDYEELAQHLASNAIVVVSFNRKFFGADDAFDQLLEDHLDYIYNSSDLKNVVTDQIGLIGHSAGGRAVLKHAGVINAYGKQLKSLVVLAPSINNSSIDYPLHQKTDSFLGLHVTSESDAAAFGATAPGLPMKSTFKAYDDAGTVPGIPNSLTLTKDMVFAQISGHFFQNKPFSLTYINAFLQVHLNGHSIFNRFLKLQEKPPTLSTKVWQQHADPVRLVLADFENGSLNTHTLGEDIDFSGSSISGSQVGWAYDLDELFSPHNTQVLKFDWNQSANAPLKPKGSIRLKLPKKMDLSGFRYFSFRITQVYDPNHNDLGTDRNFHLKLTSNQGESTVAIADHGGLLHFPIQAGAPVASQEEQTKNAMRSYVIRLTAFENVNLSAVEKVIFDFSEAGSQPTTFILDDLEFYK